MKTKLRNILIALLASAMLLGMLASCTQDPPLNEPTDESASEIITEETTEIATDPVEATTEVTSDLTEETSEDSGESTEITTEDTTDITEATTESDEATTESVEETIENTTETTEATTEFTEETTEIEIECKHTNLSAWYYCDDGDDNTYTLCEARDCVACGEKRVETRNAAVYGYFQKIEGNTSYGGSGLGAIDLSSKSVTASDKGKLKIQFFMAFANGGFDTAVYKITGEDGVTSEWITLSTRGNGISGVDAGTKAAMTEKGLDGNNTSLITTANSIDLSAYENQTVSIQLAVISKVAEDNGLTDKYVICASFVNVAVPLIDTRPAIEDIAFGSSIKVNNASAITPSSKKGAQTVTGATVDDSCQINLNGWCAVDGGVYKYVWSVDGGQNWNEDFVNSERIKTTTTEAIVTTGQAYSGKTFTDLAGAYTNAQFQSGGINIDLSNYANETVDVIFAAIPVANQDVKIVICTLEDVVCQVE